MKNKGGRPTKMNDKLVNKLKEAFKLDCSIEEACSYANISKQTFYDWKSKNNMFSDEIEASRKYLIIKSRKIVADKLEKGDIKTAIWYLERKVKSEFNISHLEESKNVFDPNPLKERMRELNAQKQRELNKKKKKKFIVVNNRNKKIT